ncbi:hypothetical protein FAZ95_13745 [Trinickia violacea]|uniref:Uncharacterized protein n=1 Tax=Trinickia violacea TaxID=2571746 RepID=A0A4P8IPE8_9BURK|nr:hypothetical protein [Trinickia violacea]QCP50146.1 hypothetical protein FAZ95_13745 [Trinickia violacea]
MQGFLIDSVSVPPNVVAGQTVPPVGNGGWGRDCAKGVNGTKVSADPMNDLLGNLLRVLQAANVAPTANRYDDLVDALNKLYRGVSSDQGNVLLVGADGKPLLTDAVVKAHETVTSQTWDAVNKVLTFTNEAGVTLTVNLAAVDAHLASASLQAGILVLHGVDGEPDVTVDLTTFLQMVQMQGSQSITLSGSGTVASPLQASVVLDPSVGNLLSVSPAGLLAKQVNADWNATSGVAQILNKPASLASLPGVVVELGNSGQANGGIGIDQGSWYQIDFRIGTNFFNGLQATINSDGTMVLPGGVYILCGNAKIIAWSSDTYQLPAQMVFAVGVAYSFPGVYQYAVQRFADYPLSTQTVSGYLGSLNISGVQPNWGGQSLWMGFSKVLGSQSAAPLHLQGAMTILKVG